MDIDAIRARKRPARRTVTIVLDAELELAVLDAHARLDATIRDAQASPSNSTLAAAVEDARDELAAAQAAARAESATFVFQAIGREAFEVLRDEHPPTKEQRDAYRKRAAASGIAPHQAGELLWNSDTFPPALIAASCLEPKINGEQAVELWNSDEFSQAELAELFTAAQAVNQVARRIDLGND